MKTMRWMVPAVALALLPLYGCQTEGEEAGTETTVIEEDRDPDLIIEDREPDVIVEERDDGFDAEIGVDEEGNVEGKVRVEDDDPR